MNKNINVAVFKPKTGKLERLTIENKLQAFYELLECDTIDIVKFRDMQVICDDNGLLVDDPLPSLLVKNQGAVLFGNLIFTGRADKNGDLQDLFLLDEDTLDSLDVVEDPDSGSYALYSQHQ
jgi:hypothetical protein